MKYLEKIFRNPHVFSQNENLRQFRFTLLHSLLIISIVFTSINYAVAYFEFFIFDAFYEIFLLGYILICIYSLYLLKKNKNNYLLVANMAIVSAYVLFFAALVFVTTDEFRLIWFFLLVFGSFILMGKKYGLFVVLFVFVSIFILNLNYDLNVSDFALFTFFNSLLIFTAFAYFFLEKIANDSLEFENLNLQLQKKVSHEVEQREEQEQMLLHQCRLASMGEMIDSIAHQWRQPLMNINAILMNMERGIETKEEPKEYLEKKIDEVITLTSHMSQTIEDFRSLFKEEKEKVSFDVSHTIAHALELFEGPLKNITVSFNSKKEVTYYGYSNELLQVLMILLSNAVEAIKSRHIQQPALKIEAGKSMHHIYIILQDNAGGISEGHLTHIFDPYFTTKERTGGTGLGLYVAKIIIEKNMYGTLSVSNVDKGAKFEMMIPDV